MRALFWNPGITRVLVVGGGAAPDGFPATPVALAPAGVLESDGRPVDGPFVAGPGVRVLPGEVVGDASPVAFRTPVDGVALGWFRGGYVAPYLLVFGAGGNSGLVIDLRVHGTGHTRKRVTYTCDGSRLGTYTVGRAPRSILIRVRRHQTSRCELRLIGGSIDVVDGMNVALRGTLTSRRAERAT